MIRTMECTCVQIQKQHEESATEPAKITAEVILGNFGESDFVQLRWMPPDVAAALFTVGVMYQVEIRKAPPPAGLDTL